MSLSLSLSLSLTLSFSLLLLSRNDTIVNTQVEEKNNMFTRKTLLPFGISMSLMVFQQWTGVNTVIFNTVTIFSAAKISINEHIASNIVGVVQLLATASIYHLQNYFV